MYDKKTLTQGFGELLGTFVLASAILGSIAAGSPLWGTALVAGIALALLVTTIGPLTGSHVNPAVTAAIWSLNKIEHSKAILYIAAQVVGGFIALYLFGWLTDSQTAVALSEQFQWSVFTAEAVGAGVFLFVLASALHREYEGGLLAAAIGGGLFLGIVVASVGSAAIINPAVAISLSSVNWLYVLAPVFGAAVGANLFALVFASAEQERTKRKKRSTKRK